MSGIPDIPPERRTRDIHRPCEMRSIIDPEADGRLASRRRALLRLCAFNATPRDCCRRPDAVHGHEEYSPTGCASRRSRRGAILFFVPRPGIPFRSLARDGRHYWNRGLPLTERRRSPPISGRDARGQSAAGMRSANRAPDPGPTGNEARALPHSRRFIIYGQPFANMWCDLWRL